MLPRGSRFLLGVLPVALLLCAPPIHAQAHTEKPLDISALGNATIPLDGLWEFHLGDNPAWASPEFDDSKWEQLRVDRPWESQGHPGYTGFAWYRRKISLSQPSEKASDLAILMPLVDYSYEIYWNGQAVGSYGKLPPDPILLVPMLHSFGLGPKGAGVLAIRVWKPFLGPVEHVSIGADDTDTRPPEIGTSQGIAGLKGEKDYRRQLQWQAPSILYVIYGLIAVVGFIAWLRDRSQWFLFWMAIFLSDAFFDNVLGHWNFILRMDVGWALNQPVDAGGTIALWFLLLWLLDLRDVRWLMNVTRIAAGVLIAISVLDAAVAMLVPLSSERGAAQSIEALATGLMIPFSLYTLVPVIAAIGLHRRIDHSRWVVAATTAVAQTVYFLSVASDQSEFLIGWSLNKALNGLALQVRGSNFFPQSIADSVVLVTVVYAVFRFAVENRRRQITLEQELQNARELQQVLIPETQPAIPGFSLTSDYRPALEVGGDFFQIVTLESGSTLVVLGDVSGKGLKAAMAVSLIVGAIRTAAENTSSPAAILAALNRRLHGRLKGGFATAVALRFEPNGLCVLTSAGHPSPFLNAEELTLPGELPLGLHPLATYQEISISLHAGDRISLYTDGLLEARNASGELYSFARLKALFAAGCNATQAAEAAVAFGQDDDITVLTVTRLGSNEEAAIENRVAALAPSLA